MQQCVCLELSTPQRCGSNENTIPVDFRGLSTERKEALFVLQSSISHNRRIIRQATTKSSRHSLTHRYSIFHSIAYLQHDVTLGAVLLGYAGADRFNMPFRRSMYLRFQRYLQRGTSSFQYQRPTYLHYLPKQALRCGFFGFQ